MNSSLTAAAQLQEGINLLLNQWTAFRMAVENEWGGRDSLQKCQQLTHELFCRFFKQTIAEKLMYMHEECLEGNFDSIKMLKETNTPSVSYVRQPNNNDEDDSEDDDEHHLRGETFSEMEVDVSQVQPTPNQEHTMSVESSSTEVPEAVVDGWDRSILQA